MEDQLFELYESPTNALLEVRLELNAAPINALLAIMLEDHVLEVYIASMNALLVIMFDAFILEDRIFKVYAVSMNALHAVMLEDQLFDMCVVPIKALQAVMLDANALLAFALDDHVLDVYSDPTKTLFASTLGGSVMLVNTVKLDIVALPANSCAAASNFNDSFIVMLEQLIVVLVVVGTANMPAKLMVSLIVKSVKVPNVADTFDAVIFPNSTSFVNVVLLTTLRLDVITDLACTLGMMATFETENALAFTITLFCEISSTLLYSRLF